MLMFGYKCDECEKFVELDWDATEFDGENDCEVEREHYLCDECLQKKNA